MRINLIFCFVALIMASQFTACTKADTPIDPATPVSLTGKVKTIITTSSFDGVTSRLNYFYNSDGTVNYYTLGSTSATSPSSYSKSKYVYSTNKITTSSEICDSLFNPINPPFPVSNGEIFLNTTGLLDSTASYYSNNPGYFSEKYEYNANKEPVTVKYYQYPTNANNPPFYIYNTFNNGDRVKEAVSYTTSFYTYEYFANVSNLTPMAFGLPFNLLQGTHLLKNVRFNSIAPANSYITEYFTYTFDSNNRVATETEYFNNNFGVYTGRNSVNSYIYY
jgi:hypothetical protein